MPHADGSLEAALARRPSATATCSPTPTPRRATRRDWTGRFGGRPRGSSCAPARRREVAARARRVRRARRRRRAPGRQHRPRRRGRAARRRGRPEPHAPGRASATSTPPPRRSRRAPGATLAALQAPRRARRPRRRPRLRARATRRRSAGPSPRDAGGARALRHGTVRGARRRASRPCSPTATVIDRLGGLLKDNAGYDLPRAAHRQRGHARDHHARALAARRRGSTRGSPRSSRSRRSTTPPRCSPRCAAAAVARGGRVLPRRRPLRSCSSTSASRRRCAERAPVYVLVECAARTDPTEELADGARGGRDRDALVADDTASRERGCGGCARRTPRRSRRPASRTRSTSGSRWRGSPSSSARCPRSSPGSRRARTILFGHLGDGNVHVNVLGARPGRRRGRRRGPRARRRAAAGRSAPSTASACEGALARPRALGPASSRRWRAIKRALDPDGLLNPGAVLEAPAGLG